MIGRFLRISAPLLAVVAFAMTPQSAFAQGNQGGGGGGNAGGGNGATGGTGTGGIEINAEGVLSVRAVVNNGGRLNIERARAAQAELNRDVQKLSKLRKVSLNRLEAKVAEMIEAGTPLTTEINYLAGLTRITHVFYYPETKDIVVAGPAEGCFVTVDNRVVGMKTGQATLQLQDLVVALRAFGPNGKATRLISCSIDPTHEGILRMRDEVARVAKQFRPGDEQAAVTAFCNALGLQEITINGVSTKTHFARVLVEADYHMKLIGIGLERPPVKMTTFIEKSKPNMVAKNALIRWFFQPDYDCVQVSEDGTAMELIGDGVKLVGEDDSIARNGERKGKGGMNPASRAYCASFTRVYSKMAKVAPLWGELRNLIDMSITAAFIQKSDFYGKAGWNMELFADEEKFPVELFEAPKHVAPVANAVWKGNRFMTPIAGGVNIQPRVALNSDRIKVEEDGKITEVKDGIVLDNLKDGQWWWD